MILSVAEIEIMHLMDDNEAEFPEAALLAVWLVRRGWASQMPAKYQSLVADFVKQGIVRNETTEVNEDMRPRLRFVVEDGKPTVVESIGAPLEVVVEDLTRRTTAMYTTHEGETHPIPLIMFDEDENFGEEDSDAAQE